MSEWVWGNKIVAVASVYLSIYLPTFSFCQVKKVLGSAWFSLTRLDSTLFESSGGVVARLILFAFAWECVSQKF